MRLTPVLLLLGLTVPASPKRSLRPAPKAKPGAPFTVSRCPTSSVPTASGTSSGLPDAEKETRDRQSALDFHQLPADLDPPQRGGRGGARDVRRAGRKVLAGP